MSDQVKRRHIRFRANPLDVAYVDQTDLGDFQPSIVALIVEEAPFGGCGLIMHNDHGLKVGDKCRIKVGEIGPVVAVLRWKREIDSGIERVGFEFLD